METDLPLFIMVDWPEMERYGESKEEAWGLQGLLTCGHYSSVCGECSSQWDFPHEVQVCNQGCGERQFDLRLQLALMTDTPAETADRRSF